MHRPMTHPFFAKDRIKDFETFYKRSMNAIDKMKRQFNYLRPYAVEFEVGHARDSCAKG